MVLSDCKEKVSGFLSLWSKKYIFDLFFSVREQKWIFAMYVSADHMYVET